MDTKVILSGSNKKERPYNYLLALYTNYVKGYIINNDGSLTYNSYYSYDNPYGMQDSPIVWIEEDNVITFAHGGQPKIYDVSNAGYGAPTLLGQGSGYHTNSYAQRVSYDYNNKKLYVTAGSYYDRYNISNYSSFSVDDYYYSTTYNDGGNNVVSYNGMIYFANRTDAYLNYFYDYNTNSGFNRTGGLILSGGTGNSSYLFIDEKRKLLFLALTDKLYVFNVSSQIPSQLYYHSSLSLKDTNYGVYLEDKKIFVSTSSGALYSFDFSDISNITQLGYLAKASTYAYSVHSTIKYNKFTSTLYIVFYNINNGTRYVTYVQIDDNGIFTPSNTAFALLDSEPELVMLKR